MHRQACFKIFITVNSSLFKGLIWTITENEENNCIGDRVERLKQGGNIL